MLRRPSFIILNEDLPGVLRVQFTLPRESCTLRICLTSRKDTRDQHTSRSGQAVRFALLRARSLDLNGRYGGGRPQLIGELEGDVLVFCQRLGPIGPFLTMIKPDTPTSWIGRRDGGLTGAATSPGDRTRLVCAW